MVLLSKSANHVDALAEAEEEEGEEEEEEGKRRISGSSCEAMRIEKGGLLCGPSRL